MVWLGLPFPDGRFQGDSMLRKFRICVGRLVTFVAMITEIRRQRGESTRHRA
jgi:hypothetical protein